MRRESEREAVTSICRSIERRTEAFRLNSVLRGEVIGPKLEFSFCASALSSTNRVVESFTAVVRKAALPGPWSQGVNLARDGAVKLETKSKVEATFRVRVPGAAIAPTVTLYLEEDEWACDCGSKIDPCAHVAAAAIALIQGPTPTVARPEEDKLVYELSRFEGTLYLERVVVAANGVERPFVGTLTEQVAKRKATVLATQDDLLIDRWLSVWKKGVVPERMGKELADALSSCTTRLDGVPVTVSTDAATPHATLTDHGERDVILTVTAPASLTEVIARRWGRTGLHIHPLAATAFFGERWEQLPLRKVIPASELGTFVTRTLPTLEADLILDIRSSRLPRTGQSLDPRIHFELLHGEGSLTVLPVLVYGDPPVARIDGRSMVHLGGPVPLRNESKERALLDQLRDIDLLVGHKTTARGHEASKLMAKLSDWDAGGGKTLGEALAARELVAHVSLEGSALDLAFTFDDDSTGSPSRASADGVIRAWQDGLDFVPLLGGGWAPLPVNWLSKFGKQIADLLAARDVDKRVSKAALPALAELAAALDLPPPAEIAALRPLLSNFEELPALALPNGLQAELRHYQELGVRWLTFLRNTELGGILADDMGLGKTLQAMIIFNGRTLVVCPKSVIFNWEAELRRFRPDLKVALYHGSRRTIDDDADVTLTTYGTLRQDMDSLRKVEWNIAVLDEAQSIKNAESQTAQAAFQLRARFRLAMSGTPVENRLEELWSLMHFANPGLLGGRRDFQKRYAEPIGTGDAQAQADLRKKTRPFILRRWKRDVVPELPPRTDQTLLVELEPNERQLYDAMLAAARSDVVKRVNEGASVMAVLETLLRLRQAACHPALVPGQSASTSSKVELLCDKLVEGNESGHKALVFSQWTSLLDLIEPALKAQGLTFLRLDGSTRDRGDVVTKFQADDGPPILLISLKAGGTGLNLTAADQVYLLDPWWNPAAEDQAADRAHRIGQDKPVFVYRMVAKDTVEERILSLQERKRRLAESAIGDKILAQSITRDDLLALLEM